MFCSNCGKELREGALFCMNCGTPAKKPEQAAPVQETPVQETPVEAVVETPVEAVVETPAEEAPAVEAPAEEVPVQEKPITPVEVVPAAEIPAQEVPAPEAPTVYADPAPVQPKKKKKFLKWLIPVVAVIAALAVALACFGSSIKGLFLKTFGANEDYYAFVEEKALEEGVESFTGIYGAYLNASQGAIGGEVKAEKATMTFGIKLGEKLLGMLENAPEGVSDIVNLVNGAKLTVTANVKDDKIQAIIGVKVGKSESFDVEAIVDMGEGDVYVGLPGTDKEYIKFEGVLDEAFSAIEGVLDNEELQALLKALPTEEELNKLLLRYIKTVLGSLEKDDVEMSSTTLEIGGVAQKCTQIDVKITPELLVRMMKNVLTAAKDDKDVKKIITRVYNALAETDLLEDAPFDDADELYEDLVEVLDEALEDIDEIDTDDDEAAVLTTYVDGAHAIIGREVKVEDETLLFVATVEKGGKTASKLSVMEDRLVLEGEGTKKGNLVSAVYELSIDDNGEKLVLGTIELKDFNEKKAEDGYLSGTVIITPDSELIKLIAGNGGAGTLIGTTDPALEMIFNTTEKKAEITVNLLVGGEMYLGLSATEEIGKATNIAIPESTVDGMDEDALMEWVGDVDDPIALLEEFGVPQEVVDLLEKLAGSSTAVPDGPQFDGGSSDGTSEEVGVTRVTMSWRDALRDDFEFKDVDDEPMFEGISWEPGTVVARNVLVSNVDIADIDYWLEFNEDGYSRLAEVIEVYAIDGDYSLENGSLSDFTYLGTLDTLFGTTPDALQGYLSANTGEVKTIALKMSESAGNDYAGEDLSFSVTCGFAKETGNAVDIGGVTPEIGFGGEKVPEISFGEESVGETVEREESNDNAAVRVPESGWDNGGYVVEVPEYAY